MNLIVFGSTGGIGAQVVAQALAAGHHVTAVARRPEAVVAQPGRLEVIRGDVLKPETIREAISAKDAVISAVGVHDRAPTRVYSQGAANVIGAMQAARVRRLICISATGLDPGPLWQRLIAKPILWALLKEMYIDLLNMETVLEHSPVDWTILRPPALTNGPRTGKFQVGINQHLRKCFSISRADVADYIVTHLCDPLTFRSTLEIAY